MKLGQQEQHHFDFVGKIGIFGGVSLALVVASLMYLMIHGMNWGIDFKGGTEVQVKFNSPVAMDEIRKVTSRQHITNTELQAFGAGDEYVIRFQTEKGATDKETNENIKSAVNGLKEDILKTFSTQSPDIRRVDSVGPQVGAELKRNGYLAVFYCLLVILIYVGLRFDYNYSFGAVVCLFHDAVITLAIFVLVGKEVNVPIMAAIMTLIGYSLNDTIVVFDRIRETEHLYKDKGYRYIINLAINNMLERTLITSGTVLTSAVCLWVFADGTVSDIAFALTVGILFGTYSSIYVASPFIILLERLKGKQA